MHVIHKVLVIKARPADSHNARIIKIMRRLEELHVNFSFHFLLELLFVIRVQKLSFITLTWLVVEDLQHSTGVQMIELFEVLSHSLFSLS